MARELMVGELSVAPGTKETVVFDLTIQRRQVEIPIFAVNGMEDGPTLAVTAGIHGAEYASIEAALQFGRSLDPHTLRGRAVVVPVVNMPAFRARTIYVCPLDGKNLNRVFPGKPDGSASEQIANWLFSNVLEQADFYVDLHGGDLIEALTPFVNYYASGNERVDAVSLEMAKVFGIHYVKPSTLEGSACWAASKAGIPAILAESGGQGLWPPESVGVLRKGLDGLMRHLGMLEGPVPEPLAIHLLNHSIGLRSEYNGLYYARVRAGQTVDIGQDLGCVTDFQGNVLQSVVAPIAGIVLYIVSSLAINKGDPLVSIGA